MCALFQIWTNGLYQSTLHRVLNNNSKYRVSVPFFYEVTFCFIFPSSDNTGIFMKYPYYSGWNINVEVIIVGHPNCLVSVEIMWLQGTRSSPNSSWRLLTKRT